MQLVTNTELGGDRPTRPAGLVCPDGPGTGGYAAMVSIGGGFLRCHDGITVGNYITPLTDKV